MKKLIVAFRNFANSPKNRTVKMWDILCRFNCVQCLATWWTDECWMPKEEKGFFYVRLVFVSVL